MKSKDDSLQWIPLWVDKWLLGSTRIELQPDERSVWVDLMALAAKDGGYIRANAITAYTPRQLAGFLCIDEELLNRAIKRFVDTGKIKEDASGIYYLINWEEFQIDYRKKARMVARMRVIEGLPPRGKGRPKYEENDAVSFKNDSVSFKNTKYMSENRIEEKRIEKNRKEENRIEIGEKRLASPLIFFKCEFFLITQEYYEELKKEYPAIDFERLFKRLRDKLIDFPKMYSRDGKGKLKALRTIIRNWAEQEIIGPEKPQGGMRHEPRGGLFDKNGKRVV